jgi:hypothetical protein
VGEVPPLARNLQTTYSGAGSEIADVGSSGKYKEWVKFLLCPKIELKMS